MKIPTLLAAGTAALALASCQQAPEHSARAESPKETRMEKATTSANTDRIVKSDAEWKQLLTPEQYHVLRKKGTERAFTGATWDNHAPGTYVCAADGNVLFESDTKFDSGTGWPSFWQPAAPGSVDLEDDSSFFMRRTEVVCHRCGGHLGHVFDDGPPPTGKRYCMNSAAMKFVPRAK